MTTTHMRIRKDDIVKIIAGKNRGKTGKVIQAFPRSGKVAVEGVNLMSKHMATRKQGEKGQKIEFAAPMPVSNVMVVCPKCSKTTRVAMKVLVGKDNETTRVRACKKCNENLV